MNLFLNKGMIVALGILVLCYWVFCLNMCFEKKGFWFKYLFSNFNIPIL